MIYITKEQFLEIRTALSAAHLYHQMAAPIFKARKIKFERDQREILQQAPELITEAFKLIAEISHREETGEKGRSEKLLFKLNEIDAAILAEDLDNVSALDLTELQDTIQAAAEGSITAFSERLKLGKDGADRFELLAIGFEGGRRYGIGQALAIFECMSQEWAQSVVAAYGEALNSGLELGAPEELKAGPQLVEPKAAAAEVEEDSNMTSIDQAARAAVESGYIDPQAERGPEERDPSDRERALAEKIVDRMNQAGL